MKALLKKKSSVVVAISEGIRLEDGRYVCELGQSIDFVDAFGHKQLSGTANYLASYIPFSAPLPTAHPAWISWKHTRSAVRL